MEGLEIYNWILSGVVGFFVAIFIMVIRNKLTNDSKVVDAINSLKLEVVKQNERIKTLFDSNINTKADIKTLKGKVEGIEIRMAQCLKSKT